MPNHWETSARPLFVKTVFVNGNRHAILFEEDPLLRCGNSQYKKTSRPNSSMSSASDVSIGFSESQDSTSEGCSSKLRNIGQKQQKDLSTELQNCLVKLKLASGNLEIQSKSSDEKCSCNPKELKRKETKEKGNSKQRRHKWHHDKICRKKQRGQSCEEAREHKEGGKDSGENSCYVYNLENYKGKKKYCFVKISSQPPQFILNCSCEKNWDETHNCYPSSKNNFVISATIHNLVMTSAGNENLLHKTFDYIFPFQNAELHWNNHLTKSYYNSLSDRVFQWLDLARKRNAQKEKLNSVVENDSSNNTERIFSGETFVGDIRKTEWSYQKEGKTNKRTENRPGRETPFEESIEEEFVGEPYRETLLSKENVHKCLPEKSSSTRVYAWPQSISEQQNTQSKENSSETAIPTKNSFAVYTRGVNPPIPNISMSPLKIQDLLLNTDIKDGYTFRDQSRRKINHLPHQHRETYNGERGKNYIITTINSWDKRIGRGDLSADKFDANDKYCECDRNLDQHADKIKNPISTEEFAERNQKSINNLNITRTRPVFIQNLLSPQQPDRMSYLQEEKIVWASEKNTGRPQLHIFMPSVLLRDQSEDSTSECDSFLNL